MPHPHTIARFLYSLYSFYSTRSVHSTRSLRSFRVTLYIFEIIACECVFLLNLSEKL